MYRIHGNHNHSPNYLIEILIRLRLWSTIVIPQHIAIACLADGLGGFSSVINSVTKNCTILFHTRPDRDILAIDPESIQPDNISRGNSFLTRHIQEGFTDFTDPGTVRRLEEYQLRYPIITSDLDSYDETIFRLCMNNIIHFCIRNTTPNGIWVLAVSLLDPHGIAICLSYLRQKIQQINLMLPRANCNFQKAYLVCYGTKYESSDTPPVFDQLIHADVGHRVSRFMRLVNNAQQSERCILGKSITLQADFFLLLAREGYSGVGFTLSSSYDAVYLISLRLKF